jgi:4-oxalocrotonate tautomerase
MHFIRKRRIVMPVVRVAFYEGRSPQQKREVAEAITEALVRVCGSKRDGVHVMFENVSKTDWVIGGAPEFGAAAKSEPAKATPAKRRPAKK